MTEFKGEVMPIHANTWALSAKLIYLSIFLRGYCYILKSKLELFVKKLKYKI